MQMVFLDPDHDLFGENPAIKGAIDVRDNGAESVASNNIINDLITSMQNNSTSGACWTSRARRT